MDMIVRSNAIASHSSTWSRAVVRWEVNALCKQHPAHNTKRRAHSHMRYLGPHVRGISRAWPLNQWACSNNANGDRSKWVETPIVLKLLWIEVDRSRNTYCTEARNHRVAIPDADMQNRLCFQLANLVPIDCRTQARATGSANDGSKAYDGFIIPYLRIRCSIITFQRGKM